MWSLWLFFLSQPLNLIKPLNLITANVDLEIYKKNVLRIENNPMHHILFHEHCVYLCNH